ncbi:MAG TPA: hypothetical protein ENH84_04315 [Phycisphaerae bacterium]|nr:hypothetical protein [Phycisphaerae bacterium]
MKRDRFSLCFTLALAVVITSVAGVLIAGDTIYVDTSGVDGISGLSDAQKATLKEKIIDDIQANFGDSNDFNVTGDANDANSADRTITLESGVGTDGNNILGGRWEHGSSDSTVYVGSFTTYLADDLKDGDGNWDLDKLANAIGRTAAHECAHSYSVGHNTKDPPNKMTAGGLVTGDQRANNDWDFDQHTKDTLEENKGKAACQTDTDYDIAALIPVIYSPATYPFMLDCSSGSFFDVPFVFGGPMAPLFDLGWYGVDTDGGLFDGDPDHDFIQKSAMSPISENNAQMITFFPAQHTPAHFVLRNGSGELFPMQDAEIFLTNETPAPTGTETYFQTVQIVWDVNVDGSPDVFITLDLTVPVTSPIIPGQYGWQFQPGTGGTGLPGDLNDDGVCDIVDLNMVLIDWGKTGGFADPRSDGDNSGTVDIVDLNMVLIDWGKTG